MHVTRRLFAVLHLSSILLFPGIAFAQGDVFSLPKCGTLPRPTQMHGAAVAAQRLYIFGGDTPSGWTNEVWSAPIGGDAQIGTWRQERPLPERRGYLANCIEVVNNHIYLVGGVLAAAPNTSDSALLRQRDVLWTSFAADGTLGEWRKSTPWPGSPLNLPATSATDKYLLLTGGSSTTGALDQILVGEIAADGALSNWRRAGKLPETRYYHGAAILEDRVFVWSGLPTRSGANITPTGTVWSVPIGDGARLGEWRQETPMPQPVYSSTVCALNDYVITVGGRYANSYPTNAIWHARLDGGRLQSWSMLKTDLETRIYHGLGLDRTHGFVFIVGGREKTVPGPGGGRLLDTIQGFRLSQPEAAKLQTADVAALRDEAITDNLTGALVSARANSKSVLAFFFAPEVPACRRVWDQVIQTPEYKQLAAKHVLAAVDISKAEAAAAEFQVFKVPALVDLNPEGRVLHRSTKLRTIEDVRTMLGSSLGR